MFIIIRSHFTFLVFTISVFPDRNNYLFFKTLKPLLWRGWGGPKKKPAFWEAGCCILFFLINCQAPPPFEEIIIITTTIIIAATGAR